MRSKFTELIQSGVSLFNHVNTISYNSCPICNLYNNLYSICTDTRMAPYEDGYIITGDLRGDFYDVKLCNCDSGRLKGYYNICHFFSTHNLSGEYSQVNGDRVYILKYNTDKPHYMDAIPSVYYECSSNIPKPLSELVKNYDKYKITECYNNNSIDEIVNNLNKSPYIKGNWWEYQGNIYGYVNGRNVVLK